MPFKKLKGRRVMLINMVYSKPSKLTDWHDHLTVVYRDMITDRKEILTIEDPEVNLFVVKPEFRNFRKPRHFMTMDRLDKVTVKYKNVLYEIAKIAGPDYVEYYKTHTTARDRKQLLKYPYVLGGDIDIITYYMTLWNEQCGNDERKNLTKGYLDIEVDQIDYDGAIARHGECEVNAITLVDDKANTVYTFLLYNGKNPLIKDFKDNINEFKSKLHQMFDESYGVLDYKLFMFEDEVVMLTQFFKLVHTLNLDIILIWNMAFDIPYLMDRMRELGMDPREHMCSKQFPTRTLYYYEDTRVFEFANKKDYMQISDSTYYIDELIIYAALRKSKGAVKKVNLGAVAQTLLKDGKLDYSDVGNIRTLPYEDYERFTAYNIKDCLLQMGIERKVHDLDNLYLISTGNNIAYKDALKQTVTFRGLMYSYMKKNGIVLGHNVNFDQGGAKYDEYGDPIMDEDDDDEDSFVGAINGDPKLNKANGLLIYGKPSKYLYGLVIDFDFSSMYPNSIVAFNIFATTMIGKLIIDTSVLKNPYDIDTGKEYVEDLIHGDPSFIGQKWHNLSTYEDLSAKMDALVARKKLNKVA